MKPIRSSVRLAFALSVTLARAGQMPSPSQVFAQHFAALGGTNLPVAAPTVTVTGVREESTRTNEFRLQIKPPGMIRFSSSDAAGRPLREGRDPAARFWTQDSEGIRDLLPEGASRLMELVLGFHLGGQRFLSERLADSACETDQDGDRTFVAIGRRDKPGMFSRLLFDATSGLLARVGQTSLDDYRMENGVNIPHLARQTGPVIYRVHSVSFNEAMAEAMFKRPGSRGGWLPQLAPLLAAAPSLPTRLSATGRLEIVRQPPPAPFSKGRLSKLPAFNPDSSHHGQVDLRGCDLRDLPLAGRVGDLLHADFDSQTRWPEQLPTGFQPERVLELGKHPGLGVRQLHRKGITGRGVSIGIIDQPLLVRHREYADRLRLYEEIHSPAGAPAQMHGPAVASAALGKTCGVAPEAELYYIAEQHGIYAPGEGFQWDFQPLAQSIHRLLDVNSTLPAGRRIRVISISVGWVPGQAGYDAAQAAVKRADAAGVFVISTSLHQTHGLRFDGLDRPALANPNDPTAYSPGSWWATSFWNGEMRFPPGQRLCVPMDSRTLAGPAGPDDYAHYASAGWSWCVPWIAGLYALACQVDGTTTPGRFWAEALATARTIHVHHGAEESEFGSIAEPVALIEKLSRQRSSLSLRE